MTEKYSQDDNKRAHSVPRNEAQIDTARQKGFAVKASPFNPVKLELGFILLIGALLMLVIHRISDNFAVQLTILLIFAVLAMLWLIHRVRQIVQQQQAKSSE